jgi:hypothetical protein
MRANSDRFRFRFASRAEFRKGCLKGKRPADADRFSRLSRIAVARLVEWFFGILVILDGSLTLLARFQATALLLAGLSTGRLILLAWPILVRHGVSFPGNNSITARSQGSFRKRKKRRSLRWEAA